MKITKKTILAIASFVILLLQALGVRVDVPVVNEVICAGASVLAMLGLIIDDTPKGTGGDSSGGAGDGGTGGAASGSDGGKTDKDEEKTDNESN